MLAALRRDPLLWLMMIALMALKIPFAIGFQRYGLDGGYYVNIAQHVRDGFGFQTTLSLYHQGMSYFPHPTPVYPVWPWVLGQLSRVIPMAYLVHTLPVTLHFLTLLLACTLVRRVWPVHLLAWRRWTLDGGHVIVMMMGLHQPFFRATSAPYTESLTYFLLFLALLRCERLFQHIGLFAGLELGLWAGLLFLTRSQMLLFTLATIATLGLGFLFVSFWRYSKALVGFTVGVACAIAPFVLFLANELPSFTWRSLLRFDRYQATTFLSPIHLMIRKSGLDYFFDRGEGFLIAFTWQGRHSYTYAFYLLPYALLLALPIFFFQLYRWLRKHPRHMWFAWMRNPHQLYPLFLVIFAIGGWLSLHTLHKRLYAAWNFTTRHGITAGFIFLIAVLFLAQHSRLTRWLAVIIVVGSGAIGGEYIYRYCQPYTNGKYGGNYKRLSVIRHWINDRSPRKSKQHSHEQQLVLATVNPQSLGPYTPDTGYHWVNRDTTFREIQHIFTTLHADYLLIEGYLRGSRFYRDKRFKKYFVKHEPHAINGYTIYRYRVPRPKPVPYEETKGTPTPTKKKAPATRSTKEIEPRNLRAEGDTEPKRPTPPAAKKAKTQRSKKAPQSRGSFKKRKK